MNGIRCALVDKNGAVVNYFMASPENDAVNSGKPDGDGLVCIAHAQALPGDMIVNGIWAQIPSNVPVNSPAELAQVQPSA